MSASNIPSKNEDERKKNYKKVKYLFPLNIFSSNKLKEIFHNVNV